MTQQAELEDIGEYVDLDIEVDFPTAEGTYQVTVREPGGGITKGQMTLPASLFVGRQPVIEGPPAPSGHSERHLLPAAPDTGGPGSPLGVRDIGEALFAGLFAGSVRDAYIRRLSLLEQRVEGRTPRRLRLRLHLQAPEVAGLPWEYLYDREGADDYMCLHQTSIVRRLAEAWSAAPLRVRPPLRILAMLASPADQPLLRVTDEQGWMEQALRELQAQGRAELRWVDGQTVDDLASALESGERPWHVFHFIGHGGFDQAEGSGFLALTGEGGETYRLPARDLGGLLDEQPQLKLVLLNACSGAEGAERGVLISTAAHLVHRRVPAVVAMRGAIRDGAAIDFARGFYSALAAGLPIDLAVTRARKRVKRASQETADWATPVLYLQTSDGRIFDVPPASGPIAAGLGAVTARAQQSEAALAVATRFGDDFRRTSEQIDRVVTYKGLHDQLDKLNMEVFRVLKSAAVSGPDGGARDTVIAHLPDLEAVIETAQAIADRAKRAAGADARWIEDLDARWIEILADHCSSLQRAVDGPDEATLAQALEEALQGIERVLRRYPERLNERLRAAASDLGLSRLGVALVAVGTSSSVVPAGASRDAERLDAAIEPLLAFKARLDTLVDEHDRWQELTTDLHEMEVALSDADLAGFVKSRDYVRPRLRDLCGANAEPWAAALAGAQTKLDEALVWGGREAVRDAFDGLRRRARNRFLAVDLELKNLCEELRPIGSELSPILQAIQ
jgi:CHAT domain